MGTHWQNGYSAAIEAFLILPGETRIALAKTNGVDLVLAEPCELAAGAECELLIIIDGSQESKTISVPDGIVTGQTRARYVTSVPF